MLFYSNYAQQLGSLIIALLGFILISKRSKPVQVLAVYGLNSVFFQVIINFNIKGVHPNLMGNLYVLMEALILLSFFYTLFSNALAKKIGLVFGVIYVISFCLFMPGHWTQFSSPIRTMRDLMIVVCALLYFYFLIVEMPTNEITRYPMFWIMAAFLFYFAGTFVLSLSLDFLVNVLKDDLALLWTARNFFRFFFCLLVSYGLWMDLRLVKAKTLLNK